MKKRVVVLAAGLVVLAASIGLAKLDPEEQAKVNELVKTLELTTDQETKIVKEREISKKSLRVLEKKWQSMHDQLRREIRKRRVDRNKVDRITAEIGKVRGEIISLRTNSLIYLKSILNEEQLQKTEQDRPADQPAGQE